MKSKFLTYQGRKWFSLIVLSLLGFGILTPVLSVHAATIIQQAGGEGHNFSLDLFFGPITMGNTFIVSFVTFEQDSATTPTSVLDIRDTAGNIFLSQTGNLIGFCNQTRSGSGVALCETEIWTTTVINAAPSDTIHIDFQNVYPSTEDSVSAFLFNGLSSNIFNTAFQNSANGFSGTVNPILPPNGWVFAVMGSDDGANSAGVWATNSPNTLAITGIHTVQAFGQTVPITLTDNSHATTTFNIQAWTFASTTVTTSTISTKLCIAQEETRENIQAQTHENTISNNCGNSAFAIPATIAGIPTVDVVGTAVGAIAVVVAVVAGVGRGIGGKR